MWNFDKVRQGQYTCYTFQSGAAMSVIALTCRNNNIAVTRRDNNIVQCRYQMRVIKRRKFIFVKSFL